MLYKVSGFPKINHYLKIFDIGVSLPQGSTNECVLLLFSHHTGQCNAQGPEKQNRIKTIKSLKLKETIQMA